MSLLLLVPVGAGRSVQRVPGARWDPVRRPVSTGVAVGHRAVPCWPFPNQRGRKHASLARPVTKHAGQVETKMGKLAKMGPEIWGALRGVFQPNWRHLRLVPPSSRNGSHPFSAGPGPTLFGVGTPRCGLVHGPGHLGVLARADRFQIPPRVHVSPTFLRIACAPVIWHGNNSTEQILPGKPARLVTLGDD